MERRGKKLYKNLKFFKNLILFISGVFILMVAVMIIYFSSMKIPDFNSFEERKIENSTKIYDRTGKILLYDIHKNTKRTDITFENMGVNIKKERVVIED